MLLAMVWLLKRGCVQTFSSFQEITDCLPADLSAPLGTLLAKSPRFAAALQRAMAKHTFRKPMTEVQLEILKAFTPLTCHICGPAVDVDVAVFVRLAPQHHEVDRSATSWGGEKFNQRKFWNLTSDYIESCRQVLQHRRFTAQVRDMRDFGG